MQLLAMHGLSMAALTGPPAIVAALEGAWSLALALAFGAALPAAAFFAQRAAPGVAEPRKIEAFVAVAAAFVVGSLLATPGFLALGMDPVSAFFEAVSAVTTTGVSAATSTADWPQAGHFLRAWLHWIGGFAFAVLAIALVLGQGAVAIRLGLVDGPGVDALGSTRQRARTLLGVYGLTSLATVVLAALFAPSAFEGALLALSAISTGGFAPRPDSAGGYAATLQASIAVSMLAGMVAFSLYHLGWRKGPGSFLRDGELRLLLGILAVASAAVIGLEASRSGGVGAWDAAFTVISAQSTGGFATISLDSFNSASLALLILVMAIGGSLGSTAGGLKVFRVAFAMAAARLALSRTALSPNAVSHLRVFGRKTENGEGVDVFALFVVYLMALFALWIALLWTGAEALPALFDTVSVLSNVGLSMGVVGPDLSPALKLLVALAMLLGRLEFLAFLILFRVSTWAPTSFGAAVSARLRRWIDAAAAVRFRR
ncbi:MAG: potassium transporter TrkG [Pseudomonadota bacterium]